MIKEITNYTSNHLIALLNDKLINFDDYGVIPTISQLEKHNIKFHRIFEYSHKNDMKNLFIISNATEENSFISIYNFTKETQNNDIQTFNFIKLCFQTLGIKKLSIEIYDDSEILLYSYLKIGFEIEGIFKKHVLIKSSKRNIYRLALSKNNFDKYLKNYIPQVLNGKKFNLNCGDEYTETRVITQKDIEIFSQISSDKNPIHLDEKYAKNIGFESNIAHGILSASYISKVLGMDFPGDGSIYLSQDLKFIKPIYPNIAILIKLKIISIIGQKITLSTQIYQNNQIVINGMAKVLTNLTH